MEEEEKEEKMEQAAMPMGQRGTADGVLRHGRSIPIGVLWESHPLGLLGAPQLAGP